MGLLLLRVRRTRLAGGVLRWWWSVSTDIKRKRCDASLTRTRACVLMVNLVVMRSMMIAAAERLVPPAVISAALLGRYSWRSWRILLRCGDDVAGRKRRPLRR